MPIAIASNLFTRLAEGVLVLLCLPLHRQSLDVMLLCKSMLRTRLTGYACGVSIAVPTVYGLEDGAQGHVRSLSFSHQKYSSFNMQVSRPVGFAGAAVWAVANCTILQRLCLSAHA